LNRCQVKALDKGLLGLNWFEIVPLVDLVRHQAVADGDVAPVFFAVLLEISVNEALTKKDEREVAVSAFKDEFVFVGHRNFCPGLFIYDYLVFYFQSYFLENHIFQVCNSEKG
jgi:hypothetical protein